MDYNTSRNKMILPEYGRNIHKMVEHCLTIEDRQKRTECAQAIVGVMSNIAALQKDVTDFRQKLWDHLMIISDFRLDIDAPFVLPTRESTEVKIGKIPYPKSRIEIKHYGKNTQKLIETAVAIEDEEDRKNFAFQVANHMKKSYLLWNKDVVTDEKILEDLAFMSGNKLAYTVNELSLSSTTNYVSKNRKKKNPNKTIKG